MKLKYWCFIICLFVILLIYIFYQYTIGKFELFYNFKHIKYKNYKDRSLIFDILNSKKINLYYINLEKSKDRNTEFLSKLNHRLYNPIRINAENEESIKDYNIKYNKICNLVTNIEFACLISHIKAICKAYQNETEYALICEDDMYFNKDINIDYLVSLLPSTFDFLQLHICCLRNPYYNYIENPIYKFQNSNIIFLQHDSNIFSNACYILSKKAMRTILDKFIKFNLNIDLDNINTYNNIDLFDNIICFDFTKSNLLCIADIILFEDLEKYVYTNKIIDINTKLLSTISPLHDLNKYY